MYKIQNDQSNTNLKNLLTEPTAKRHDYNVRSQEDLTIPKTSTNTFQKSSFPATTKLWNSLDPTQRKLSSLEAFKDSLKVQTKDRPYYYTGKWTPQILHARLRMECSDLPTDMARLNLTEDITCACGALRENAEHYILLCNNFLALRFEMLHELRFLYPNYVNINTLLRGNGELSHDENKSIFIAVQKYIIASFCGQTYLKT
jgi:hypothetical protein